MRQVERSANARAAAIAAASSLFGRQGYAGVTMDAVARAAGLAKGGLYHHFADKRALFEAVLVAASEGLARRLAADAVRSDDILEAMAAGTEAYLEACSEGPLGQVILKDGPAVLGWQRWREIDAEHFGGLVPAALAAAVDQGLIAPQPIEPLARLLLGAMTEAAVACAASQTPRETGEAHGAAFRALLEGLRRGGPAYAGS